MPEQFRFTLNHSIAPDLCAVACSNHKNGAPFVEKTPVVQVGPTTDPGPAAVSRNQDAEPLAGGLTGALLCPDNLNHRTMSRVALPVRIDPLGSGPDRPGEEPPERGTEHGVGLATKPEQKVRKPSLYRVVLLNDDYTPQEFVVWLLQAIFNKTGDEAYRIMLHVHQQGVGICGIYTFEVAETKVTQVMELARRNEHPLQCVLEKA